ncbi:MAG: peptide-methionine (R)-S-oxide reductase MsrB [Acidimicrobiales bacterium]
MSRRVHLHRGGLAVPGPEVQRTEDEWKNALTPEQYAVLRHKGTEAPFTGAYVHCKEDGTYHCAACGAELFGSDAKFDSGTGWPSFTRPSDSANVELSTDRSHGMVRTEVTCRRCGSHLGHVFPDGPGPEGQRYCINSVSLALQPKPARQAG